MASPPSRYRELRDIVEGFESLGLDKVRRRMRIEENEAYLNPLRFHIVNFSSSCMAVSGIAQLVALHELDPNHSKYLNLETGALLACYGAALLMQYLVRGKIKQLYSNFHQTSKPNPVEPKIMVISDYEDMRKYLPQTQGSQ